jgi:6-pyruvoyltetrahydropterin/6-carboxytetrahydropterin synthase
MIIPDPASGSQVRSAPVVVRFNSGRGASRQTSLSGTVVAKFAVRVTKDYLVFCAAHFITFGGECETLHGHNYRVTVRLEGKIDENYYVFDFVTLKNIAREECGQLDHRMLLPTENPHLTVEVRDGAVTVRFRDRVYQFPESDVVLLPVPNTTAEMLARYLAGRLRSHPLIAAAPNLEVLEVEVEESFGQSACCREVLRESNR